MSEDRSVLTREARDPDEELSYGSYPEQMIDVWHAQEQRPAIIFIHGGFWRPEYDRVHARPLGEALADEGWPVASIDYRREPGNPDSTATDVRDALDRLPDLMDLRSGFVLAGHSAGGHLALWAAGRADAAVRLAGVVSQAGVHDLREADRLDLGEGATAEFMGGSAGDLPDAYADASPIERLPLGVPALLVHGEADERVPASMSSEYAEAARTADDEVELSLRPGEDHFVHLDVDGAAWADVVRWLERFA
jgi:acetyl esterase/lipase